jgi:hypothetical protein
LCTPVLKELYDCKINARFSVGTVKSLEENINNYNARRQKLSDISDNVTDIKDYLSHSDGEALRLKAIFHPKLSRRHYVLDILLYALMAQKVPSQLGVK